MAERTVFTGANHHSLEAPGAAFDAIAEAGWTTYDHLEETGFFKTLSEEMPAFNPDRLTTSTQAETDTATEATDTTSTSSPGFGAASGAAGAAGAGYAAKKRSDDDEADEE